MLAIELDRTHAEKERGGSMELNTRCKRQESKCVCVCVRERERDSNARTLYYFFSKAKMMFLRNLKLRTVNHCLTMSVATAIRLDWNQILST